MKEQEWHLSLRLYVCLIAALTIAVGQDIVCFNYRNPLLLDTSYVNIHCESGNIIIVNSAVIGLTGVLDILFQQCPTASNCLNEITSVSELCTGRNSCDINRNFIFNVSQTLCSSINILFNTIIINYTCIPALANYGDICHFDEDLYSGNAVHISSYPKLPDAMGPETNYQCSCLLTSKVSSSSAYVTIRALLVQLTGKLTNCSERLSIVDSRGDNKLEFCSPCTNTNNVTTVSLASDTVISFRRDSDVSPYNGKFILEITVSSQSSSSVGSMKCDFVASAMSSPTAVSAMSSSSISNTTTSAMLSQPNGFSSTSFQNTSPGTTLGSSIIATSSEQSTPSSSKSLTETQSSAIEIPTGDGAPALSSKTASEKNSISTGGIVGIVLGSVGLIVIVVIALLFLLRKRKQYLDHSKENTNFNLHQSDTVIQNMRATNNIDLQEATSSELYRFQSSAHFSNEPQTRGSERKSQTEDNSMSNYEEGAPVSVATYGPGMIQADEQRQLRSDLADDLTTGTQSMNSEDDDVTLVENQLYVENANPVTGAVVSDDYDVARPVSNNFGVERPVSNNFRVAGPVSNGYDVERPVVQDGGKEKSAEVDGAYAVVQPMTNSVDHSYYNVPTRITTYQPVDPSYHNVPARTGNGTEHSSVEVSAEAGASSASDEGAATNPMYKADSDVVLIDNTLYGSMLAF